MPDDGVSGRSRNRPGLQSACHFRRVGLVCLLAGSPVWQILCHVRVNEANFRGADAIARWEPITRLSSVYSRRPDFMSGFKRPDHTTLGLGSPL